MDGMSTQDILNGQDISTANVDDLLAAMAQVEGAAAAPVEEPKPKKTRKKAAEPEAIAPIPNLDEILASSGAEGAAPAEDGPVDIDAIMAAMNAVDAQQTADAPVDVDAMMAAMMAGEVTPAEAAAAPEAPVADAPVDVDAMMAAMMAGEAAPVEAAAPEETPAPENPVNVDAMMAAMAAAETATDVDAMMAAMMAGEAAPTEAPAVEEVPVEAAPEAPVADAPAEAVHESPAENLDAILNAEIDAMTGATAPEPEIPQELDPVAAAMMAAEAEAAPDVPAEGVVEVTEPVNFDAEPEQTPAAMDIDAASDAMEGAVEDIEDFLSAEDYEYTLVKNGDSTLILMKTADNNSMAICYEGNEFDSLDPSFSKDGRTSYRDIMNGFVKDTIKNGGTSKILRHKGSKVVAR